MPQNMDQYMSQTMEPVPENVLAPDKGLEAINGLIGHLDKTMASQKRMEPYEQYRLTGPDDKLYRQKAYGVWTAAQKAGMSSHEAAQLLDEMYLKNATPEQHRGISKAIMHEVRQNIKYGNPHNPSENKPRGLLDQIMRK